MCTDFENTQKNPRPNELGPISQKALADDQTAPSSHQASEPFRSAEFSNDNVGWELEDNVGYEELLMSIKQTVQACRTDYHGHQ